MKQESIERKLSHRLMFLGLLAVLVTAVLLTLFFHRGYERQIHSDMSIAAQSIARGLESGV